MALTRPNVELHIEELVLHGFAAGDRHAIATAVEVELGRLLAVEGLPGTLGDGMTLATLDAGAFETGALDRAAKLGERIGRSLYRGMGERTR